MDKGVKGKLIFTLFLVLLAIVLIYPPSDKVIKTEEILQVPAITAGEDGVVNTTVRDGSDDQQLSEPGSKVGPGEIVILPGPDGILQTVQNRDADGKLVENGDDVKINEQPPKTVYKSLLAKLPLSWFYLRGATKEEKLVERSQPDGSVHKVKVINYVVTGKIRLGLDLRGGSELLYRIKTEDLSESEKRGITDDTIAILQKRIDPQGVREIRIQEQGAHRILIQLPGMTQKEVASVKRVIETVGKLDFYLVNDDPDDVNKAAKGRRVKGFVKKHVKGKRDWFLISEKPDISGKRVRAYPTQDRNGLPAVGFEFIETSGKKQFARLTSKNIGKKLAIVLDGELYSAPVIRSRIPGNGIIEGDFTQDEVTDLVTVLKAGSLRADVVLEMESSVGPSLGEDSITRGIWAIIIGSILVILVMLVYYFGAGLVADTALLINMLWIIGIVALFKAALTLPGIAGLILTVGMAVDANVLIFERIREEKEKGKSLKLAVDNGYDRALTTIVDANLTTLITAIILLLIGTGPVRGFAVTLSAGIISSMFAALFVTRAIFQFLIAKNIVTEFKMSAFLTTLSNYLQRINFSFLGLRKVCITASVTLIILGLVAFAARSVGDKIYDTDFSGGLLFHFALKPGVDFSYVQEKIRKAGYKDFELQSSSTASSANRTGSEASSASGSEFTVRLKHLSEERCIEKMKSDLVNMLKENNLYGNVEVINPAKREFKLVTSQPIDEKTLRGAESKVGLLGKAGYFKSDIEKIVAPDIRSSKFALRLRAADTPESRRELRKKIVELLGDKIKILKNVTYTFGDLKPSSNGSKVTLAMDIIGKPIDVEVIQESLEKHKAIDSNTIVEGRGSDVKSMSATKVRITGSEKVLRELKSSEERKRPEERNLLNGIYSVFFTDEKTLEITLKDPLTENELYSQISSTKGGKAHIRGIDHVTIVGIIPLNAPKTKTFEIAMAPLSDNKKQEKVANDLLRVFKEDANTERIGVTFKEVKNKQVAKNQKKSDDNKSSAKQSKTIALIMHVSKDMRLSEIKSRLETVGHSDVLAKEYKGERGTMVVKDVTLNVPRSQRDQIETDIKKAFEEPHFFKRTETIGPVVAGEMKEKAYLALGLALFAIVFYIRVRFNEWRFGFAAIIALAHDVLVAMGAIAIADWISESNIPVIQHIGNILLFNDIKISLPVVAAFLTIIGYSLNDTIVVFDRIRENMGTKRRHLDEAVLDLSINQTLSRTLLTSITTFVVVLALYVLGGSVIHGFAFALLVGVVVGTYSSIFIASPILADWEHVSVVLLFPIRIIFFLLRFLMWPLTRKQTASGHRTSSAKRARRAS